MGSNANDKKLRAYEDTVLTALQKQFPKSSIQEKRAKLHNEYWPSKKHALRKNNFVSCSPPRSAKRPYPSSVEHAHGNGTLRQPAKRQKVSRLQTPQDPTLTSLGNEISKIVRQLEKFRDDFPQRHPFHALALKTKMKCISLKELLKGGGLVGVNHNDLFLPIQADVTRMKSELIRLNRSGTRTRSTHLAAHALLSAFQNASLEARSDTGEAVETALESRRTEIHKAQGGCLPSHIIPWDPRAYW